MMKPTRGLTLPELLVALAVVAILVAVAAPSFRGMIEVQRLRGVNSQVVTDLQFARNESAARGVPVRIVFRNSPTETCYSLYTSSTAAHDGNAERCNCLEGAGNACTPGTGTAEVKTVSVPATLAVKVTPVDGVAALAFDPVTGGILTIPIDRVSEPMPLFRVASWLDDPRRLYNVLNQSGRPSVCAPAGTRLGETPCAP